MRAVANDLLYTAIEAIAFAISRHRSAEVLTQVEEARRALDKAEQLFQSLSLKED
jgi:hypothetical protein